MNPALSGSLNPALSGSLSRVQMRLVEGDYFVCFLNLFLLFIYFWPHWVFIAVRGLSLVAASGGYSSLRCTGFSLRWLLLLRSTGSRRVGFSSYGTQAQ